MIQLEGRNPVYEALNRGRVQKVLVAEGVETEAKVVKILDLARRRKVPVEVVPRARLDSISETSHHQGVIATAQPPRAKPLRQLLEGAGREACVLLLDQVQDPQNLGAILRTSEGAGVDAVVIPKKGGADLTPTVHRVSMGGSLHVPVYKQSLYQAVKLLKEEGFRLIGVDPAGPRPYFEEDLTGAVALILGGENRGISPTLLEKCDSAAHIPMRGVVESLNVSVAAAIVLYERVRQLSQV